MKVLRIFQIAVFCLSLSCVTAVADSLELRNGHRLQGKYIGGSTTLIGFMTGTTVEYFSTADVLALIFDNGEGGSLNGLHPNPMKGKETAQGQVRSVKNQHATRAGSKLHRAKIIQLAD